MSNQLSLVISRAVVLVAVSCLLAGAIFAQATTEETSSQGETDNSEVAEGVVVVPAVPLMPAIEVADTTDPAESKAGREETVSFESTHKQANCFRPEVDGKPAQLSTFRLRPDGHIVACVWPKSSNSGVAQQDDTESGDDTEIRGYVHVYSPDFELVDQFGLPFQPSALDVDSSGNMFVAGEGRIGRMARDGEIEIMADSPTLAGVDMEELKEEVRKEMKEQLDRSRKMYEKQIETFSEQISEIEATDENERSDSQSRRLKSLKAQVRIFEDYIQQQNDVNDQMIEYRLKSKSKITAVAVSDKDVFVATGARQGSGYEVYRMNRDLNDAECVLKGLRGCCGQMDIHARGEQVYVAENTKFSVGVYDRDGNEIDRFGERLKKDNQGFGSCCNPMNVICCPDGNILTAESSIGKIKRFDENGEMIGYVGRARIGGGCKHVAIGFDEQRDRYYVQYEDNHQICVLMPRSSVSENKDPRLAEFTRRLTVGKWQLAGADSAPATAGIGILLRQNDSGEIIVKQILENSPVEKYGKMKVGDVLVAVGRPGEEMQDVDGMEPDQVSSWIQGRAGESVRVKYQPAGTSRMRRTRFRQAMMEQVDGKWVFRESPDNMAVNSDSLSRMKSLEFRADGTVSAEQEVENRFGGDLSGLRWLATRVDGETLFIDIESADEMIMYRVKVRFEDNHQARISVSYDGLGQEGEFRDYRVTAEADRDDDPVTADISTRDSPQSNETDGNE